MIRIAFVVFVALTFAAPLGAEELTGGMFDVTSAPKGVLSETATKAQWTAYQRAKECMEHPTYSKGSAYKIESRKGDFFKNLAPRVLFPSTAEKLTCLKVGSPGRPPKPMVAVKLDERYGEQLVEAVDALRWIQHALALQRYKPLPEHSQNLKGMLVAWAEAKALGKGINVSWGARPVDWHIMTLIAAILQTYIEVQPELTAEEQMKIGPWVNGLVAKVAASRWRDRQDNKQFQTAMVTALWGLAVGDRKAVQRGIDIFKLGIHGMRPDGSQPIDSQRGGMGIQYNSTSTGNLFMIAAMLKRSLDVDLFAYEVEGRSIHTAVEFVVSTIKDPSRNKIYAIRCPDSGDRWGSIDKPSLSFADTGWEIFNAGYLLVYADLFPQREASTWIKNRFESQYISWKPMETFGASPACMLGVK